MSIIMTSLFSSLKLFNFGHELRFSIYYPSYCSVEYNYNPRVQPMIASTAFPVSNTPLVTMIIVFKIDDRDSFVYVGDGDEEVLPAGGNR